LVLTTGEKSWWLSMQEVIPAVERVWTGISRAGRENVRMLRVPLAPEIEQRLQTSAPQLERIVITVATPATVRIALFLRLQLKIAAPMIVYIYGDATEGFHALGALPSVLTERDMLVVSCEAEAVALRCSFPNARVSVIPLPLVDQFKVNDKKVDTGNKTTRLAYVGRISEQKNLHTLLFALWILRTSHGRLPRITLDVYGGEDNLGSPNMGIKFPNYGAYLQGLAESVGVDDSVTWHGLKPRGWLFDHVHPEPHIFVSPTLHSDENFGSSLLASLVNGHQAVTTAWGGHFGFQEWFSQQLTLVPVHRSTMGPVVHPVLLANAILRAVDRMSTAHLDEATLDRARAEFSESTVTSHTLEMLSQPGGKPVPLKKSPTQRHIDERRAFFGGTRKIYADYKDPVAQIFFEAYGMEEPLTFDEQSSYVFPPWTSYSDHVLRVDDPHRGHQSFRVDARISTPLDVTLCPSMNTCRLPESLVKTLVTQGYAFSLPPVDAAEGESARGAGVDRPELLEHVVADARRRSDEVVTDA
jgi:glycosyltransferase involved in cell wall biosynthesis